MKMQSYLPGAEVCETLVERRQCGLSGHRRGYRVDVERAEQEVVRDVETQALHLTEQARVVFSRCVKRLSSRSLRAPCVNC